MPDADDSTFSGNDESPKPEDRRQKTEDRNLTSDLGPAASDLQPARSETEMHERVCSAAEIFSRHSERIRAIIGFHIEDKSKVDDVFQQFFISLVHNPIPAHIEDVEKYLYRALANDVIDSRRRANQYRDRLQKYAEQHRYDETAEDPRDNALQAEAVKQTLRLLRKRLSKREAAVVWQHYGKGLSRKAIARKTNLDEGTVIRYITLARKKMRKFIPQHIGNTK